MTKIVKNLQAITSLHKQAITSLHKGERVVLTSLEDNEYHKAEGLSSSQIKDAMQSLMYFDQKYNKKVIKIAENDHFCIGKLVHCMVLEPSHVGSRYVTKPDVPKPTIKQRASYDKWVNSGKPHKSVASEYPTELTIERCEFWDNFSRRERTVVTPEQWQLCQDMADAISANPIINSLLSNTAVETEHSYFAMDEKTELLVKARPDIKVNDTIVDIKSIGLREPVDEEFLINKIRYEIKKRKYHVSAAMYLDITKSKHFYFAFVNKEPNYHWVAVVQLSDELLSEGYEHYRATLDRIKIAKKNQEWPDPVSTRLGYDDQLKHYVVPIL